MTASDEPAMQVIYFVVLIIGLGLAVTWLFLPWILLSKLDKVQKQLAQIAENTRPAALKVEEFRNLRETDKT